MPRAARRTGSGEFGSAEQAEQDGAELGQPLANREDVTHAEQVDDPVHGGRLAIRHTNGHAFRPAPRSAGARAGLSPMNP